MNATNAVIKASLYFQEGSSDKEYHTEIIAAENGHIVNFRYGRRGGTLTGGTKTSVPVDFAEARQIFDKLVKAKTAKGYTEATSGTAYQHAVSDASNDFAPQLLNPVSILSAMNLINDALWAAQEKMDGERRAAHADAHQVFGANRTGKIVPLPAPIALELQRIAQRNGSIRVDGELIGDRLHVFDLHILHGQPIHDAPWINRIKYAENALAGCKYLRPVPVALDTRDKLALYTQVLAAHGEGVVFKRISSKVTAGRPASGGDWLKFKFTTSASCYVIAVNAKRSVQLGLLTRTAPPDTGVDRMQFVGNVTIPPNHELPVTGDIIEVEYLYAFKGGCLFQPVYRGKRTDLEREACVIDQLKYKPEGSISEDDAAQLHQPAA